MGGGIILRLLMCSTLIQISIVVAGSNLRKQGIREGIRPVRHLVSKSSSEKSNRRTFVTALLAAEVAYLESLLAKLNSKKGRPKKPKSLPPTRHVTNQIRVPQPKQQQHKQKKNPAIKEEFVSKPDPFYMIDAPDLSVKPSKSSESLSKVYVVSTSSSPPPPAIYSSPSTTSTSPPPKQSTKAPHTRKPGTTLKYGDFELYHPRGYLPPPAPKRKAPQEQKKKTASASYFKIKPATYHPKAINCDDHLSARLPPLLYGLGTPRFPVPASGSDGSVGGTDGVPPLGNVGSWDNITTRRKHHNQENAKFLVRLRWTAR